MATSVLLADDHTLLRQMLRAALASDEAAYAVTGEASEAGEALRRVGEHRPNLLLLDYDLPGLGPLSVFCQDVARLSPETRILVLGGLDEPQVALEAAVAGAHGYISKRSRARELLTAFASLAAGGIWVDPRLPEDTFHVFLERTPHTVGDLGKLTRQELRVLTLIAQGMSNRQTAAHLNISRKTVTNHLTHIFAKLGVADRHRAILHFLGAGHPQIPRKEKQKEREPAP
jgi:DNA-binding NarL/FixJ family response regulator